MQACGFFLFFSVAGADADVGEGMKDAGHLQQPYHNSDDYDGVDDGLYRGLHWNEIDQPEDNTYYD
jgi:hypothetical protein